MDSAKQKITFLVEDYIRKFPGEFDLLKNAVALHRNISESPDSWDKSGDMKRLYEISETLQTMFIMGLDEEETVWLKSKAGGNWFIKKFPVFSLQ